MDGSLGIKGPTIMDGSLNISNGSITATDVINANGGIDRSESGVLSIGAGEKATSISLGGIGTGGTLVLTKGTSTALTTNADTIALGRVAAGPDDPVSSTQVNGTLQVTKLLTADGGIDLTSQSGLIIGEKNANKITVGGTNTGSTLVLTKDATATKSTFETNADSITLGHPPTNASDATTASKVQVNGTLTATGAINADGGLDRSATTSADNPLSIGETNATKVIVGGTKTGSTLVLTKAAAGSGSTFESNADSITLGHAAANPSDPQSKPSSVLVNGTLTATGVVNADGGLDRSPSSNPDNPLSIGATNATKVNIGASKIGTLTFEAQAANNAPTSKVSVVANNIVLGQASTTTSTLLHGLVQVPDSIQVGGGRPTTWMAEGSSPCNETTVTFNTLPNTGDAPDPPEVVLTPRAGAGKQLIARVTNVTKSSFTFVCEELATESQTISSVQVPGTGLTAPVGPPHGNVGITGTAIVNSFDIDTLTVKPTTQGSIHWVALAHPPVAP
jgi:hypothetical protein